MGIDFVAFCCKNLNEGLKNTSTNPYLNNATQLLKEIKQMSKITISDLHRSESEYGLIDLSSNEQKAINGGLVVIVIIFSDGSGLIIVAN